jgi:hypothetical protein
MALLKRATLKEWGLTDEQMDKVITEVSRGLSDYDLKSNIQAQIDEAVSKVTPEPINVLDSAEYQALLAKSQKLEAFQTEDFSMVKSPYKDIVWDKLDHGEKHEAYGVQLKKLQETMPDLFSVQEAPKTPQFGAPTQGSMPSGKEASSFNDVWGFVPKK